VVAAVHHLPKGGQDKMSALKSLTFTALPKIGANPTLDRRTNMIARLEEQKVLLKDPNYIRTVRAWVKKDGRLTPVDKQQIRVETLPPMPTQLFSCL
jgi:hypothetical protein